MTESTERAIVPAYAATMPAPQGGALPTGLEWQALERMAHTLAESDLIPYRLKRKPGDVAVILLAAREYGIPPLMALSKLPVVNGTPAPMGELMVALVLRAGHYIAADFRNPDGTVYKGGPVTAQHYGEARYKRADWPDRETMTFTLDEGLTAGLIDRITPDGKAIARVTKTKNGNQVEEVTPWEQYTPNMARWRAVANACRLAFADVLMGLSYLPEELGAIVDADGAPIDGEVVAHRDAPTGNLEQRTAQESADKLTEQPWPDEVLNRVRASADRDGYLHATVTYAGTTMTLAEAITRHVEDRTPDDTVDADVVEPTPHELAQTTADQLAKGPHPLDLIDRVEEASETAGHLTLTIAYRSDTMTLGEALAAARTESLNLTRPDNAEGAGDAQNPPEEPPAASPGTTDPPAEAPQPENGTGTTLTADAHEVAVEALTSAEAEYVRGLYRGSADLLAVDVTGAVTGADLETLGLDPELVTMGNVPLGGLLHKVGAYVDRHKVAVRSDPAGEADVPFDPWADGSASG